jgi:hypothetical protein
MYTDIHASNRIQTHNPVFEQVKTVHALDLTATVIGSRSYWTNINTYNREIDIHAREQQ